jgi:hypothetical protein
MSNDVQIKKLRTLINDKRSKLGEKPKLVYKTNASFPMDGGSVNINTMSNVESCVRVYAELVAMRNSMQIACEELGEDIKCLLHTYPVEDYMDDIKTKLASVKWITQHNDLQKMDKQLATLLSEESKTEESIADIAKSLGI